MRTLVTCCLTLLLPSVSFAQTKEIDGEIKAKLATLKYVTSLESPAGGFKPYADGQTALRPTSAALRAIKYLGGKVPNPEKHADFVMKCYDPISGGFSDLPGGKPDVFITSVGVMAAVELDIPREKFKKAMDFINANAMTFEDVRIGAAAVEAWGVKDCPFDLKPWFKIASNAMMQFQPEKEDEARFMGSVTAFRTRLGDGPEKAARTHVIVILNQGQRQDGGWGKGAGTGSEMETTYRVMRAYHMMKAKPGDVAKLRAFVAKCRNADGGYGVAPGQPSNVGATYYAAIVAKWLDELER